MLGIGYVSSQTAIIASIQMCKLLHKLPLSLISLTCTKTCHVNVNNQMVGMTCQMLDALQYQEEANWQIDGTDPVAAAAEEANTPEWRHQCQHMAFTRYCSRSLKLPDTAHLFLKQSCVAIQVDMLLIISHSLWFDLAGILCYIAASTSVCLLRSLEVALSPA